MVLREISREFFNERFDLINYRQVFFFELNVNYLKLEIRVMMIRKVETF